MRWSGWVVWPSLVLGRIEVGGTVFFPCILLYRRHPRGWSYLYPPSPASPILIPYIVVLSCPEYSPDFFILDHPFKLSPYTISPHHHTPRFLVVYYHTVTMAMAKHSFSVVLSLDSECILIFHVHILT